MTTTASTTAAVPRRALRLAPWAALALLLVVPGRADAQWGFGPFGFGWGYPHPYTPPSVNMLNQRANVRAGMDQEALNRTSLTTPDHFDYRRQQVALQQRQDVETMRGIDVDLRGRGTPIPGTRATAADIAGAEEPVNVPAPGANAAAPAVPRPDLSVASFVNEEGLVVWPSDAPISGDLGPLRDRADEAIQEVVQQEQAMDYARVDTVATAREALLAYGRPALQFIRDSSTPRVADTFHLFLLSLYDALAQAAERSVAQQGALGAPR